MSINNINEDLTAVDQVNTTTCNGENVSHKMAEENSIGRIVITINENDTESIFWRMSKVKNFEKHLLNFLLKLTMKPLS